jgi:hypothetical protein
MVDSQESLRCALLSAREEAYLWELIGDFRARFPDATIPECERAARESAATLLNNGWAQLVSTTWAASSGRSPVPQAEALETLHDSRNWSPPPTNDEPCFHLLITDSGRDQPF